MGRPFPRSPIILDSNFMGKLQRIIALTLLFLNCCVEPYSLKSTGYQEVLVVDGFISSDLKQHQVKISRTSPIDKPGFIPETGAQVSIKSENGSIPLTETSPGVYLTPPLMGIIGNTYSLSVTTQRGQQLTSDEVTLNDTPDIKNIYATYSQNVSGSGKAGVQIFLDTQDATKKTRFYRWEYIETWEIQTPFYSEFNWLGGNNVVFRDVPVSICYGSDSSKNALIQSTQGLSDDKISAQLIQTLTGDSPNLRIRYSILIRQFSISENSYLYWQTLQKVNESQGTLYDTQPGTVVGNITSSNGNVKVLGYFDAGVVKEKRAFFTPKDFSAAGYSPPDFESDCNFLSPTQVPSNQIGAYLTQNLGYEIWGATGAGPSVLFLLPKKCLDCTPLGTNIKPSFWP